MLHVYIIYTIYAYTILYCTIVLICCMFILFIVIQIQYARGSLVLETSAGLISPSVSPLVHPFLEPVHPMKMLGQHQVKVLLNKCYLPVTIICICIYIYTILYLLYYINITYIYIVLYTLYMYYIEMTCSFFDTSQFSQTSQFPQPLTPATMATAVPTINRILRPRSAPEPRSQWLEMIWSAETILLYNLYNHLYLYTSWFISSITYIYVVFCSPCWKLFINQTL